MSASPTFPPIPPSLKPVQHYLKTAAEHDARDVVVAYWSRYYAIQVAMKIDSKSDDARLLLVKIMDWLETCKKMHSDNDVLINEVAAQAHIENYALKLFNWADSQDQSGVFNKNVVKAFYSAGMLMDVLNTFGELNEDIGTKCKYAKWKAAYIHNCLKNGEVPLPGAAAWEEQNDEPGPSGLGSGGGGGGGVVGFSLPEVPGPTPLPRTVTPAGPSSGPAVNFPDPACPPTDPASQPISTASNFASSGKQLSPDDVTKAQKYCKWAISALNYDDVPEAVSNLQKALKLLVEGEDS